MRNLMDGIRFTPEVDLPDLSGRAASGVMAETP